MIAGGRDGGSYRVYQGRDAALDVLAELVRDYTPRIAIWRPSGGSEPFWYAFDVDPELLERLAAGGTLERALDLHEGDALPQSPIGPAPRLIPKGIDGTVTLFPAVTSDRPAAADGDDVLFTVALASDPSQGSGGVLDVTLPAGQERAQVVAVASSDGFARPAGESWTTTFTVDRALAVTPATWTLRGRALGDRASYTMSIRFFAGGAGIGQVALSLEHAGRAQPPAVLPPRPASLAVPAAATGLTLSIARDATGYQLHMLRDGEPWGAPVSWVMPGGPQLDTYFDGLYAKLESAAAYADLKREVGYALWLELPAELRAFFAERPGAPLHIESDVPVAPFEALQLDPAADGALLGESRPVTRWIASSPAPALGRRPIGRAACIRPDYPGRDALPSAADEETDLRARFPALEKVATRDDLDALLDASDVGLVHFAGHADGNPARLVLQSGPVGPEVFHPSRKLFRAQPFLFLNGCRAALGRSGVPAAQANLSKTLLLGAGCAGLIAPLIKVQSAAALAAERAFYGAIAGGATVGAAMSAVRALAAAATGAGAPGSYLSYLAFAHPALGLGL